MRTYFQEMLRGPGHFRFLIQPLIAIALGIRDGRLDEALGRTPFILSLFSGERRTRGKQGLRAIAIPLVLATTASLVFQFLIMRQVHVWLALLYALVFVALPYALVRAATNRALRRRTRAA